MILGRIKNGIIEVQRFFKDQLPKLENKEVEIKVVSSTRSSQQNRYYWGVILKIISQETGFTPEEAHEVYKKKFLTYQKEYKGKKYDFVRSTTDLDIFEFGEYLDKVIGHARGELNLIVPESEDYNEFVYPE